MLCYDEGGTGLCLTPSSPTGTKSPGDACNPSAATNECRSVFSCSSYSSTCTDNCGTDNNCNGGTCQVKYECGDASCTQAGLLRSNICTANLDPTNGLDCSADSDCVSNSCTGFFFPTCDPATFKDFGANCSSDSQCRGNYCDNGKCSEPCCTWLDCPGTSTCMPVEGANGEAFKICRPYAAGVSVNPDGDCDLNNPGVCKANYCFPKDPVNTSSSAGYCSETCCSDSDCSNVANSRCQLLGNGIVYPDGGYSGFQGYCVKL
jgi:hypothetical protein